MTQLQQLVSVRSGGRGEGGRERDVRTEEERRKGGVEERSRKRG